jgi:hypothetical protein
LSSALVGIAGRNAMGQHALAPAARARPITAANLAGRDQPLSGSAGVGLCPVLIACKDRRGLTSIYQRAL